MTTSERDLLNRVLALLSDLERIMQPHRRRSGAPYQVELIAPPPLPPSVLPGQPQGPTLSQARSVEDWRATSSGSAAPPRPTPAIPWTELPPAGARRGREAGPRTRTPRGSRPTGEDDDDGSERASPRQPAPEPPPVAVRRRKPHGVEVRPVDSSTVRPPTEDRIEPPAKMSVAPIADEPTRRQRKSAASTVRVPNDRTARVPPARGRQRRPAPPPDATEDRSKTRSADRSPSAPPPSSEPATAQPPLRARRRRLGTAPTMPPLPEGLTVLPPVETPPGSAPPSPEVDSEAPRSIAAPTDDDNPDPFGWDDAEIEFDNGTDAPQRPGRALFLGGRRLARVSPDDLRAVESGLRRRFLDRSIRRLT